MTTKLYHHKTDGGAEYLTDTFFEWKHDGKSGREGIVTHDTKICIRLDGRPEMIRCKNEAFDEMLEALQAIEGMCNMPEVRQAMMKHEQAYYHKIMRQAAEAIFKATR